MNFAVLLFVFGLSAAVCSAADGTAADNVDESGKFLFFAPLSTTTHFTISTTGLTVLSTCFTAVSPVGCTGRRKRRFVKMDRSFPSADGDETLVSSLSGSVNDDSEVTNAKEIDAKYFFTLWSTVTSTLVVVSTSIDGVNIVSVSAFCSIAGNVYTPCG